MSPRPELLEELELLEDEEELLEEELELLLDDELELLEELELLDEDDELELEPLEPGPPQAVSAAASKSAGTNFILWYFPYTFIMTP